MEGGTVSGKRYQSNQDLNRWLDMLDAIYGPTQNYPKSAFEVHSHLTEVCGVFGKHLFKRGDVSTARRFLPKIFAWGVGLLKKMRPGETDLEGIILRKFPGVCSYCGEKPCVCWKGEKPSLDAEKLRKMFFRHAPSIRRSVNDFQLMFRGIYEQSWLSGETKDPVRFRELMRLPYLRMIEELAEMAESVRFHHLYPENFENELADFFAWWFAIATCLNAEPGAEAILAEDILWAAYPGYCLDCQMIPCFCRPGPVRELMSKPPPGHDQRYDGLTSVYNQAAFNEDLEAIVSNDLPARTPLACVRIDIDDFKKSVNDVYGHAAGDAAIQHVASILRRHVRERDRVYRISGDEFGILFMDYTEEEASGAMKRVCGFLAKAPVRWISAERQALGFAVGVSIGVAECQNPVDIKVAFEAADAASYASKRAGKARVTCASKMEPKE